MAETIVSVLVERLADLLIQESELLRGVEDRVEWIERELRLMHSFLEPIEALEGLGENLKNWAVEMRDVAQDAVEVIDTLVHTSARKRRRGILKRYPLVFNDLIDRHKLGKELERIKLKIIIVSERRKTVLGEEKNAILMTNTIISPVIEKVNAMLGQKFHVHGGVIELANLIIDEFTCIHDSLKDVVESAAELDERESVWMEEIKYVSRFADDVFGSFLSKREEQIRRWQNFKNPVSVFKDLKSQYKFGKKIRQIEVKIRDVRERNWTYGIGEFERRQGSSLTVPSIKQGRRSFSKAVKKDITKLFEFYPFHFYPSDKINEELASLLRVEDEVESFRRDLRLMNALFRDVQGLEDLDERVKVWVEEMRDIASHAETLNIYINERKILKRPGFNFKNVIARAEVLMKIKQIKKKVHHMSERKRTYDIGKIRGRKGLNSLVQSQHEVRPSISNSVAQNSGIIEEARPGSRETNWRVAEKLIGLITQQSAKEQVESIRGELKLMHALFKDVEAMEEPDARVNVWLEEMQGVAHDAEDVIQTYDNNIEQNGSGIFKKHGLICNDMGARLNVAKKINRIKNQIRDISKLKRAYDITVIKGRGGWSSVVQNLQEMGTSTSNQPKDRSYMEFQSIFPTVLGVMPLIFGKQTDQITQQSARELEEQVESIKRELRLMHALFKDIEAMEKPDERMKVWVEEMRGVARDADAVIQPYVNKTEQKEMGIRFKDILNFEAWNARLKVAREINRIKNKIQDISERTMAYESYDIEHIKRGEESNSMVQSLQSIMAQLLANDTRCCVISIVGMEGTGKTTLTKLIVDNDAVVDHFPCLAWVPIPQEYNARAILQDIGKQVKRPRDLKEKWIVEEDPTQMLSTFLMDKRYLIVLDDVRTTEVWDSLKEAFPNTSNGSRIVLTTRNPHKLQLLSDDESWALFRHTLKDLINKDLPLYLRRCLFYFGLFPKDFDVPARRLIVLWVAEGLVHQQRGDKEPPENVAEKYLTELINRNIVQVTKKKLNGKVKTCCLPGDLRESPRTVMIHHLADHLEKNDASFDHIHGDNMNTSLRPFYKDVFSFLSFDTQEGSKPGEDIGNFLHRCISSGCFQLLRVLDLERVFRPKLPKVLGKITRLRYLGLRWTYSETLPSFISNFLNLQTLDLKHTYISSLPSSIWKMQQLRHLYLSESYRSRFVPRPSGGSLMDLQTLWGVFVDEESPVKDGLDRSLNLRKLGLACRLRLSQQDAMSSQLDAVADWVLKLVHLQSLRLRSNDEQGRPWYLHLKHFSGHMNLSSIYLLGRLKYPSVVSEFPQSITELTLSASGLVEDPMQILDKLPKLIILRLLSDSYIGKNMHCSSGGFPKLQVLKLWKLKQLEEWNVEVGSLPALRDLEMRSCTSLKMLPDGLQHVRTLQELKLSKMPKELTDRIKNVQGQDWVKIAHVRYVFKEVLYSDL